MLITNTGGCRLVGNLTQMDAVQDEQAQSREPGALPAHKVSVQVVRLCQHQGSFPLLGEQ